MNVFDIAAMEHTDVFSSHYPFVNWMGVWIHNFHLLPTTKINLLFWGSLFYWEALVDSVWVGVFALKQTNKKDLATSPSVLLKERKNKMSQKAGHAFTAKCMSPPAEESSSEVDFETLSQVYMTANIFWKCEQNIHTMMSATTDPRGRKVSLYHFNELNWTRIYGKPHLISKHRACW